MRLYPRLCGQRHLCPRGTPCPRALWENSWEQPNLLPWTRYAPSITYPAGNIGLRTALVWSTWGSATRSVRSILDRAVRGILSRHEYARDMDLPQKAQSSLQWLASKPVEDWYWSLTGLQHRIFCTLLYHISLRCRLIGRDNGCFIALNYAVSLLI